MKKLFFVLLVLVLFMGGCKKEEVVISEVKEISFHHYFSAPFRDTIQDLIENLNVEADSYQVQAVPLDHESFKTSVISALETEGAADMYSYWAGAKTKDITNLLLPLTDSWYERGWDQKFTEAIKSAGVFYDDEVYLVPITQHYIVFYYNKRVFKDFDLQVPTTYDELIEIASILQGEGITPFALGALEEWPAQFWFDYLLLRTAGYEYRQALMEGEASYTDPQVLTVMETWKNLIDRHYFNEDATRVSWAGKPLEELISGKAGMMLMGTWMTGLLTTEPYNLLEDEDFGVFSFPILDPEVSRVALGPIDGLVVTKKTSVEAPAFATIDYLISPEVQMIISRETGGFSPTKGLDKEGYSPTQQALMLDIEEASHWAFNYDLATPPEVSELGLDFFVEFYHFPAYYKELLRGLEEEVSKYWKQVK